jgi:hypothetical protein
MDLPCGAPGQPTKLKYFWPRAFLAIAGRCSFAYRSKWRIGAGNNLFRLRQTT